MRKHLVRTSLTIVSVVMAIVLLGAFTFALTSVGEPAAANPAAEAHVETKAETNANLLLPRRAISIPFGISSVLTLTQDGSQIDATGHGVCWVEGQMFDLRVRIAQSTTHAFAEGRSVDICAAGARQSWDAQAAVASSAPFEPGNARACAEATEFAKHGIADEYQWCKDILVIAP